MTNQLSPISEETVETTVSSLHRKAAHAQRAVSILAALKHSGLVGRVLNRSCLPLAQKALAEYSVRYTIDEYSSPRWRCLYVSRPANTTGTREAWEFRLATREAPRLTAETLSREMDKAREQAQAYTQHADELTANVPVYNTACACLAPIWGAINVAMLRAEARYW